MRPPPEPSLAATRRTLHGLAELLLAGPQLRATGTMRLAVRPGGFATVRPYGDVALVAVDGIDLAVLRGGEERRFPVAGTYEELAAAAGLQLGGLEGAYRDASGVTPTEPAVLDGEAAAVLASAWATGDAALRALAAEPGPVLWPEHFDVAVTLDAVNYGVSPGDDGIAEPYAYVGPHERRDGPFWNEPFGAARPLRELGGEQEVLAFFTEGRRLTAGS